ncbi:hypothetical protein ACNNMU_01340 [Aerococcus viridans]
MKYVCFKISLFISSLFPLVIMIFLDNLESFDSENIYNLIRHHFVIWGFLGAIMLVSCWMLIKWLSELKNEYYRDGAKYNLNNLESQDGEVLNYFATYLVPLISLNLESGPSILLNVLFLTVVGIYFVKNNTFYHNILLLVLGYHIYRDNRGNVLITKKNKYEIENKDMKADQFGTGDIFYID